VTERRSVCPGNFRHWFSFYGWPGFRSPVCVRCGAPNPRPLGETEWGDLIAYLDDSQVRGPFVWPDARAAFEAAITARKGGS
jgi:hypothetical protein